MENNNGEFKFNTIEEALEDIKNGKMVIVVDDPDRENEGDIVMAAELVKPEHVNFITRKHAEFFVFQLYGTKRKN